MLYVFTDSYAFLKKQFYQSYLDRKHIKGWHKIVKSFNWINIFSVKQTSNNVSLLVFKTKQKTFQHDFVHVNLHR